MATLIETRTTDPTPGVRSYDWPVLQSGDMSFPNGCYTIKASANNDRRSLTLKHTIRGAPLLATLVEGGKASYACAVSSPVSSYREFRLSDRSLQHIDWDPLELGQPPFFTPMVVSNGAYQITIDARLHGLQPVWDGLTVQLLPGSRLAVGPVFQLRSSLAQMLLLELDEESLGPGQFTVSATPENGFQFKVSLGRTLFDLLKRDDGEGLRNNIMPHLVTSCLGLLQRQYSGDDGEQGWQSHPNLTALSALLVSKGSLHWSDDDFEPAKAATAIYPHSVPEGALSGGH